MDSGILQRLKKEIQPRAEELLKANAKTKDKLLEIFVALDKEIEKKNERMIRHHVKALELIIADLATRISKTAKLLQELEHLDVQPGQATELQLIEKLTAGLSELERKMSKNYGIAKSELDKSKDVLEADEASSDAAEATREWAVMEAWLRKQSDNAKKRLDQMTALRENARKAAAARNARAVEQAAKASASLLDAKPTLEDLQEQYKDFCSTCDAQLTGNQRDQLARDRDKFDTAMREITAAFGKLIAMDVEINALEIGAVDVRKAAAVLKVPASHEAKLKKALEGDANAMIKTLDGLAKELKLKTNGKAMVEALKKAGLL